MVLAMTFEQIHAACELLDWPLEQLSDICGIPVRTIRRIEQGEGNTKRRTLSAIRTALESAGIEFTNGDQPGLRLKKAAP